MEPQIRQDRSGALAAPISARIYEGRVAKIHGPSDPLRYEWGSEFRNLDGIRSIADQLQSGKTPFTLLHPPGLIASGSSAKVIGHVITAHIDGEYVVAQILITDPEAERAIKDGTKELSLGYTSQLDSNHNQINIKIDHLSLVPRARCGPACALRTDCSGAIDQPDVESCPCNIRAVSYNTVIANDSDGKLDQDNNMDELQKKLAEALAEAATLKVRADSAEAALATTKAALTAAEIVSTNAQAALVNEKKLTEAQTLRADQAKLDAENAIAQAKMDADSALTTAVTARVQLMTEANTVLGNTEDRSALSDQAIRLAVIKHVDNLDFSVDKDPVFVSGVYAGSLARAASAAASRSGVRQVLATPRVDADAAQPVVQKSNGNAAAAELAAKQEMIKSQSNRWNAKSN